MSKRPSATSVSRCQIDFLTREYDMALMRSKDPDAAAGYVYWLDAFRASVRDDDAAYQTHSGVMFDDIDEFWDEIRAWVGRKAAMLAGRAIAENWANPPSAWVRSEVLSARPIMCLFAPRNHRRIGSRRTLSGGRC